MSSCIPEQNALLAESVVTDEVVKVALAKRRESMGEFRTGIIEADLKGKSPEATPAPSSNIAGRPPVPTAPEDGVPKAPPATQLTIRQRRAIAFSNLAAGLPASGKIGGGRRGGVESSSSHNEKER